MDVGVRAAHSPPTCACLLFYRRLNSDFQLEWLYQALMVKVPCVGVHDSARCSLPFCVVGIDSRSAVGWYFFSLISAYGEKIFHDKRFIMVKNNYHDGKCCFFPLF